MNQHIMYVCTSCASAHRTKQAIRVSGGERLLDQLRSLHRDSPLQAELSIQPIECLLACEQDCAIAKRSATHGAIALSAAGKHTYLFGRLPVEEERLELTAAAVLEFAKQYHSKSDGGISYLKCPELLKKRVLAKIPPLPSSSLSAGASS